MGDSCLSCSVPCYTRDVNRAVFIPFADCFDNYIRTSLFVTELKVSPLGSCCERKRSFFGYVYKLKPKNITQKLLLLLCGLILFESLSAKRTIAFFKASFSPKSGLRRDRNLTQREYYSYEQNPFQSLVERFLNLTRRTQTLLRSTPKTLLPALPLKASVDAAAATAEWCRLPETYGL